MGSIIPNGVQQFLDNNGNPLVGGRVHFYIPGTTTNKNTWQNPDLTILNTNPITLNARGEATIWGNGRYRQIVYDQWGNLIWDRITQPAGADLEADDGASHVGFMQAGIGAVRRSAQDKMRDILSVRDFIDTPVNGTTSNQNGIEAAIAAAIDLDADLEWPRGTYVSTDNIADFWKVSHIGPGVIKRGSDIWFISPRRDHRNILRVSSSGLTDNDGLSLDFSTTASQAFLRLQDIGQKPLNGRWRVHLSGNISFNGVKFYDLPIFKNRLEIFGDDVALNDVPTTVWDGSSATEMYALRGTGAMVLPGFFYILRI